MSLTQLWRAVRVRMWLVVLAVVVATAVAVASAALAPDRFASETTMVTVANLEASVLQGTEFLEYPERPQANAEAHAAALKSQSMRIAAANSLGLTELGSDVDVSVEIPEKDNKSLTLRVEASDADLAADVANAIAESYVQLTATSAGARLDSSLEIVDEAVATMQERIAEIDVELAAGPEANLQAERDGLSVTLAEYTRRAQMLETAQISADPDIEVLTPAAADDKPLEKFGMATFAAPLIGLIFALGVVAVMDQMDDTLRFAEDFDLLADEGVALVGRVVGPGADDMRSATYSLEALSGEESPGLLALLAVAGDEAPHALALGVAAESAVAHGAVLCLDATTSPGDVASGRKPTRELPSVVEDAFDVHGWTETTDGLSVLTASVKEPVGHGLREGESRREFDDFLHSYDRSFAAGPSALETADALLFGSLADRVVLVARLGKTRASQIRRAIAHLESAGANVEGVVLATRSTGQRSGSTSRPKA